ncbi:hypothetical protein [Nannocystis pusilla]|uniref:ABC transporter permease n=1 Tax=Nannocystis pusilla TaxID=889268 RepID=UPI003DA4FB20
MPRLHASPWLALWATFALAAPLAGIVLTAAESDIPVQWPALLAIAADSLLLALGLTALALALAYPLARAVTAPWLLLFVMVAPLARAFGALALGLSPGTGAVALARLAGNVPLAALLLRARLRTRPRSWLDAAADLGAGPWRRFLAVEWPHLRPAYLLAAVCITLLAIGDATIAAVAGGGKRYTLGLALREAVLLERPPAAGRRDRRPLRRDRPPVRLGPRPRPAGGRAQPRGPPAAGWPGGPGDPRRVRRADRRARGPGGDMAFGTG